MEAVGSVLWERSPGEHLPYVIAATIEELLEMLGTILFIRALLGHVRQRVEPLELRVANTGD
jgi:hypothetical protein